MRHATWKDEERGGGLAQQRRREAVTSSRTTGAGRWRPGVPHGWHGRPDRGKGAPTGGPKGTVPRFDFVQTNQIDSNTFEFKF
jgi:hypothetical protein